MWSIGVLLYTLVSGYYPFFTPNRGDLFKKIKAGEFEFKASAFKRISSQCQDLIQKLLVKDPAQRITGKDALDHEWFKVWKNKSIKDDESPEVDDEVVKRLLKYKGESTIKRAGMNMLVKMLSEGEVKDLRKQFEAIDKDGTGMIHSSELAAVLQKKEMASSTASADAAIKEIDYYGNGKINYSEFIAATISIKNFMTD